MRTTAFVCALLSGLAAAAAQSANTLAGMDAYNHGDVAAAYRLLNQKPKQETRRRRPISAIFSPEGRESSPISGRLSDFITCQPSRVTARE
jgi:hypothetical protein